MSLVGTSGIYGLMAIYEISKGTSKEPVSIKTISEVIGVSKNYLEQILNLLKTAKIISSIKGVKGGYFLIKPLSEISFYEIFSALQKDFCFTNTNFALPYTNLFNKFEEELKEIFNKPLSEFQIYNSYQYLNYTI